MYGAIALAAAILLTATVSSGVLAQGVNTASRNTTTGTTTPTSPSQANNLPNITGSIHLRTTISGALSSKVKTSLVGTNTSATLGLLRPLYGYLVYDIHVKNDANNTTYAVIVDPGTGKVLYKQALPSLLGGGTSTQTQSTKPTF